MKNKLVLAGGNIRTARQNPKISQAELAGRAGLLHRTYMIDVERARRNLSFLSLLAKARGLVLTVPELNPNVDSDTRRREG